MSEAALLLILALISDIRSYKIKNTIVFPFILLGMATNFLLGGVHGLAMSFLAVLLPVALLFILFVLRMLGAGDIKLFSAIGAITGPGFVMYTMAYSFICGGVIAFIILLLKRNGMQRLNHLYNYIKSSFLSMKLLPYTDFGDKTDNAKFRFAYAIACGSFIQILLTWSIY